MMRDFLVKLCSVGVLSAALLGCDQVQPQQVCAPADTLTNVQDLLNETAVKEVDKAQGDGLAAALKQLWAGGNLKLDLIALKSVDKDTKKIDCSAQLQIKLTDGQQKAGEFTGFEAANAQNVAVYIFPVGQKPMEDFKTGQATIDLTFSRQPSADGKGYLYGFQGPSGTNELLRYAAATQMVATKPTQAAAAPSPDPSVSLTLPASPPASDAPSSDLKPDSVAPGSLTGTIEFDHDAAGGKYAIVSNGQSYTLRYVGNLPDDVQEKLSALEDAKAVVTAKGDIQTWKDGSKSFSDQAPIVISR